MVAVTQWRYIERMKSAILPQVAVEPEVRAEIESVLGDGETLEGFIEASVRNAAEHRRVQRDFEAEAEEAWQDYLRTGVSYPAEEVIAELREMLETKRRQLSR